jgi:hypothetical protein
MGFILETSFLGIFCRLCYCDKIPVHMFPCTSPDIYKNIRTIDDTKSIYCHNSSLIKRLHQERRQMEQCFLILLFPDTDPVKIAQTLKEAYENGSSEPFVEAGETMWQIIRNKKLKPALNLDKTIRNICLKGFTPQTSKLALMVADYDSQEAIKWLRKNGEIPALSRLIWSPESRIKRALFKTRRALFIKNIGPSISKPDLLEKFGEFGKVVRCTLPIDPETGQPKSYAFVEYQKAADALRASKQMHNRVVWVEYLKEYFAEHAFMQVRKCVAVIKKMIS